MQNRLKMLLFTLPAILLMAGCEERRVETRSDEVRDSADRQRREAERDLHSRLDRLDAKIQQLREDARRETGPARERLNHRIEELAGQRGTLNGQMEKLRVAGRSAWSDLKQGVNRGINQLEDAYNKTQADMKSAK
jgi:outer membrane murein-binding lipoprotein Lpp